MPKIALRPDPDSVAVHADQRWAAPSAPVIAPAVAACALIALVLAGVAYFLQRQQALTGNLWGVPVDDAYIHFRFVRNLVTGHGFAFNPDQPVPGSTSPLWVLALAVPTFCGAPVWLAAKVGGVLFLCLSAALAWRLAARHISNPVAAWTVGALTALDGRLLWASLSGMEAPLFTALSLAAFLARPALGATTRAVRRRLLLIAALCGMATLARPEGLLLTVVLLADLWLRFRPRAPAIATAITLYFALIAPYVVFALATTGHPLPTTFYAKSAPLSLATAPRALVYLAALAYVLVRANIVVLLAPLGALALWRAGRVGRRGVSSRDNAARALVAWPVLLIVEQAVVSPALYHFGRYVMPLQPFLLLWAVAGLAGLRRAFGHRLTRPIAKALEKSTARRLGPRGEQRSERPAVPGQCSIAGSIAVVVASMALITIAAFGLSYWARQYALSVRNINDMQVTLGRWVREHVPLGAPVATHDVGAIGYISNHPIVDIEGLITPRFIALKREQPAGRRAADIDAEVRRMGARYLIVFPQAYGDLLVQPGLRRVYSVTVDHPTIVQEPTMAVYEVEGRRAKGEGRRAKGEGSARVQ